MPRIHISEYMSGREAMNILNCTYYTLNKLAEARLVGTRQLPGCSRTYRRGDVLKIAREAYVDALPSPTE